MKPCLKTFYFILFTLFVAACGKDSSTGQSGGVGSRGGDIKGTWQYAGSGYGTFRSATLEVSEDFVQLDALCTNGRGSAFSPIEMRANSFLVKETHGSGSPCVAILTKGEKGFKLSGDSLILDGVLGSSRWRRK